VRFYVRRELLHPQVGRKGGSRPYQIFSAADLEQARTIRIGQALRLSLEEISALLKIQTRDEPPKLLAFLEDQRGRLMRKVAALQKLIAFLDAKISWTADPDGDAPPKFPL
jgi:MerR family transcriptional regulator, copper efflux regulator